MNQHPVPGATVLTQRRIEAFSLVEVVMALGIVAFALVALIGLLPTGLGIQKNSTNEARSIQVLNQVVQTMQSISKDETTHALSFASPLETLPVAPSTVELVVANDGTLTGDSSDSRGAIVIEQQSAPVGSPDLLPVYISVAWPATATYSGNAWKNAEGSVETFIYVTVPN